MNSVQQRLVNQLMVREREGTLRFLPKTLNGIDFYSNDYLGFARNVELQERLHDLLRQYPHSVKGATGSRLISGNSVITMEIEEFIAKEHGVDAALLLPSGFVGNLSLFSVLPQKGDTILLDEKIHRSVIDGCRLSPAKRWKFKHNNLNHLEELIQRSSGQIWIGVESLYSMDGDFAPLSELVRLAHKYSAALIVDEAHAIGTFGLGLLNKFGLQNQVFASLVTYGKAMGHSGAAILGSKVLIEYLINYASAFIYSTALSDFHALAIKESYLFLKNNKLIINGLMGNVDYFNSLIISDELHRDSPIKPIKFKDLKKLQQANETLLERGFLSCGIKAPTVREGEERIRICLHAFNSKEEINLLGDILKEIMHE